MASLKWLIILASVLIGFTITQKIVNSCSLNILGPNKAPTSYTDCTSQDPKSGSCCYVEYKQTTKYCAYIPGNYVNKKAIDDFIDEIGKENIRVECTSRYIKHSLVILLSLVLFLI